MTKDEILAYVPPAAKMLGREVVEIDQVNGGAVLRFRALPGGRRISSWEGLTTLSVCPYNMPDAVQSCQ